MKNINYKKLKRYNIGKLPKDLGYEQGQQLDLSNTQSVSGYQMSGANDISNSIVPSVISKLGNTGIGLYNTFSNYTTKSAAEALGNGTKAGLNTLGYIGAGIGAITGGFNMANDIYSFKNTISPTDIQNTAGYNINQIGGRQYKTYGNIDEQNIRDYVDAQNNYSKTNLIIDSASTAASIGSIFGPIGSGVGAVIGGIFGGIFGNSSAKEREQEVEKMIKDTKNQITGYNLQSESIAGSQNKQDQFYNADVYNADKSVYNADKGKNPNQQSYSTKYGNIVTPSGITKGKIQGYASPDEGEIDMSTGETIYNGNPNPYVKDKRADIVPVGVSGNSDEGAFDRNIAIPGHQRDIDGIMFADKARPYFEDNEYVKQEINKVQNGKGDKVTKKYMLNKLYDKYTANSEAIQQIVDRQSRISKFRQQLNADCGKNAKGYICGKNAKNYACGKDAKNYACGNNARNYACGKDAKRYFDGKALQPLLGLAARLPYAIADQRAADSEQPYAQNSYVPNSTAQSALNTLASLYYDPSSALYDLVRVGAQNKYNIMNTGNLSSGQKAALISASNNQLAAQRYNILTDAFNRNAQYKQAYANALMNHGRSEAMREQQALATQQEAYRQAVGAKQKLQAQARKNWYNIANQTIQDFSTNDFYNKLIKLYGNDDNIIPTTNKTKITNSKTNNNNIDYFDYPLQIPKNGYFVDKILSNNFA